MKKRANEPTRPTRGRADLERLRRMTEAEIRRTAPPELADLPDDFWDEAELVVPAPKQAISLRVDEVKIPSSVIKDQLERWARAFQSENHRPPGRKEKNDAKQEIRSRLRTRFPLGTRTFDVSWNLESGQLQICRCTSSRLSSSVVCRLATPMP